MNPKNNPYVVEGHSLFSRPPFFDGANYTYWKQRMKFFLKSTDVELWLVIVNGPHIPMKIEDGKKVVKQRTEWNEEDKEKDQLNNQATHMLLCAIKPEEYMKLSSCSTAKEVWDKLQVVYEGIGNTRLKRMNGLIGQYESFKMREDESLEDMFRRFSHIINDLQALGKVYSSQELVQKVLRSLSSPWDDKVDAMKQSSYVEKMTYDELRGDLITYVKYVVKKEND